MLALSGHLRTGRAEAAFPLWCVMSDVLLEASPGSPSLSLNLKYPTAGYGLFY